MRTVARFIASAFFILSTPLLLISILKLWKFGACYYVRSSCGSLADWMVPGWIHDQSSDHDREWVPGRGWEVEYSFTREEWAQMMNDVERLSDELDDD